MAEEKQTPAQKLEVVKGLPLIDRVIFLMNTLEQLKNMNMNLSGKVALTKQQEVNCAALKHKAKAYKDLQTFIFEIFAEELREKMKPVTEELQKEVVGNG